jgi:1-acyl-sn-glycerol-3-phosphate acyltransferase
MAETKAESNEVNARKATAKKATAKKATTKKATAKKATAKKATAKKATAKKASVKKASVKKASVKKASVKKASVKKASVKKASVKKASVKKASVKKATVKKTAAKKKAIKKKAVKKAALKKGPTRKTVTKKKVLRKSAARKAGTRQTPSVGAFAQLVTALAAIPTGSLQTLASGSALSRKAAAELQSSLDRLQGITQSLQSVVGGGSGEREELNGPDPELMNAQAPLWNALMDYYFRLEIGGWERIPDEPSLLIGVHSGGPLTMDAWTVVLSWWRHFGESRRLHGTAHDVLMGAPGLGSYFRRMGAVVPTRETLSEAFRKGDDVIIWPGGEMDAYRSFGKRDKAVLGGRKGFIRLAIREQVPIVPLATVGGHETLFVLSEGRGLAKVLKLKERMRSDVAPITLSVPFGVTLHLTPFQHVPLPAKIRTEFLEPIYFDTDPDKENDNEYVARMYSEVESRIQAGMDRLAKKRKFPIWG